MELQREPSPKLTVSENHANSGHLEMILGPMLSGKTSTLISELTRYSELTYKVCYVNFIRDNRPTAGGDGKNFTSHSRTLTTISPKITCYKTNLLSDLNLDEFDVIGIDESHFYTDLVEFVIDLVEERDKHVIAVGLDGSFKREPIGAVQELLSMADNYYKVLSQCKRCITEMRAKGIVASTVDFPAPFTIKKTASEEIFEVDGEDTYESVCRKHYREHIKLFPGSG